MARITGNKGEWSELYVLIYLLANGKLNAADGKLNKLRDIFFPVLTNLCYDYTVSFVQTTTSPFT